MRTLLIISFVIISQAILCQGNSALYQDDYVKVSFKKINDSLGYVLEDYNGMFGGTLVEFKIDDDSFILKELDSVIIIDSMIFIEDRNYKKDSVMLSLVFRINEFPNAGMSYNHLTYIINDTLKVDGTRMYKNDNLHRTLIRQLTKPYKLEIEAGYNKIGPFIIDSKNDVEVKIVVLMSSMTFEFDHGKDLPNKITFDGKTYKLIHNFKPWD